MFLRLDQVHVGDRVILPPVSAETNHTFHPCMRRGSRRVLDIRIVDDVALVELDGLAPMQRPASLVVFVV